MKDDVVEEAVMDENGELVVVEGIERVKPVLEILEDEGTDEDEDEDDDAEAEDDAEDEEELEDDTK